MNIFIQSTINKKTYQDIKEQQIKNDIESILKEFLKNFEKYSIKTKNMSFFSLKNFSVRKY